MLQFKFINIDELVFEKDKNPFPHLPFKMKKNFNTDRYEIVNKTFLYLVRGKN